MEKELKNTREQELKKIMGKQAIYPEGQEWEDFEILFNSELPPEGERNNSDIRWLASKIWRLGRIHGIRAERARRAKSKEAQTTSKGGAEQ